MKRIKDTVHGYVTLDPLAGKRCRPHHLDVGALVAHPSPRARLRGARPQPLRQQLRSAISHDDYYAYCELKVAAPVPLRSAVAAFYPQALARKLTPALQTLGFKGWMVPFAYHGPAAASASESDRVEWATAATAAVLEWAAAWAPSSCRQ